jgi:hypothetical protein
MVLANTDFGKRFMYPYGRDNVGTTHLLGRKGLNAAIGVLGCGLQSDKKQFFPPCLGGPNGPRGNGQCTNIRWQDGYNQRAVDRQQLRRAFGNYMIGANGRTRNLFVAQLDPYDNIDNAPNFDPFWQARNVGSLTPFRRAMNAGDPFNRANMLPDREIQTNAPSNQIQGRLRRAANQAANSTAGSGLAMTSGGSAYTGNPKFVYDGSDYVRYKKLLAKNNNYNDPTFGGDDNFASQTARARVRH